MELSEVSQATGFHAAYVSQLVAKYRDHGLEAISGNHYGGNHRNMSFEEEAAILAPFKARAEKGELVEISEIETAYQQAVGHSIGTSQIYYVLHRHGWRKVMPRSRHPKKASEEVIETSKEIKAAPHNSARSLRQDFCSNSKFRKWRNTVCISHFRNCGSGAKRRLRLADAIVRCCLKTTIGELKNLHMGCGKVRLMFQDEAGFGRINHPKYCWCEKGIRPSVPCHHIREYRYAYGAVEPLTGESCFLVMPIAILRV